MKVLLVVLVAVSLLAVVVGCGVSQEQYDTLRAENERLATENNNLTTENTRLSESAVSAYRELDFANAANRVALQELESAATNLYMVSTELDMVNEILHILEEPISELDLDEETAERLEALQEPPPFQMPTRQNGGSGGNARQALEDGDYQYFFNRGYDAAGGVLDALEDINWDNIQNRAEEVARDAADAVNRFIDGLLGGR